MHEINLVGFDLHLKYRMECFILKDEDAERILFLEKAPLVRVCVCVCVWIFYVLSSTL